MVPRPPWVVPPLVYNNRGLRLRKITSISNTIFFKCIIKLRLCIRLLDRLEELQHNNWCSIFACPLRRMSWTPGSILAFPVLNKLKVQKKKFVCSYMVSRFLIMSRWCTNRSTQCLILSDDQTPNCFTFIYLLYLNVLWFF